MTTKNPYESIESAVLEVVLREIESGGGWTAGLLATACDEAGVDENMRVLAFPRGVESLVRLFFARCDDEMMAELGAADIAAMKIRERISFGVSVRLKIYAPHKAALRAAVGWLAQPKNIPLAGKLLFNTSHLIWRWAGDVATDYNYYSKRIILSGVLASTISFWLNDEEQDYSATQEFLSRRIENVMEFEKLKAKVKDRFSFWDKVA